MMSGLARALSVGSLAAWLLAAGLAARTNAEGAAEPSSTGALRVLILTGQGDHSWQATTPVLRRILADTRRFDVRLCEDPEGLGPQSFAGFDVVVDNGSGIQAGSPAEKALAQFVESGKGLVLTHGALGALEAKSSSAATVVPAYWPVQPGPVSALPVQFVELKVTKAEHPVLAGVKFETKVADAVFRGLAARAGAEVITSTVEDPALIVAELGKGRVFADALGHDPAGMLEKAFITTFARGTEWAATGKVTLPAEIGPSHPDSGAVRGLVIVGGHDHETAFYSIFEGFKDLDWLPLGASGTAFQKDFRNKYDVVIMYDFTRELDETGKKNLREFVESGKGVVVLHHALLNYQKWNWWYQDTVGGSYRLSREGNTPSSSVKDREHIFVTPKEHPITAGIAPFHIVDECYGRMYISPKITPLLTTDNPNSTSVVGWVGPDPKNKVVAIQLGHGHTAFAHPSYRTLVHNAILWAAGRIK